MAPLPNSRWMKPPYFSISTNPEPRHHGGSRRLQPASENLLRQPYLSTISLFSLRFLPESLQGDAPERRRRRRWTQFGRSKATGIYLDTTGGDQQILGPSRRR